MMFEEDWLIRQIREIAAFIWSLLSGKSVRPVSGELRAEKEKAEAENLLYRRLMQLLRAGRLAEAEDALFAAARSEDPEALKAGLLFYEEANLLSDDALEGMGFRRKELSDGLIDLCAAYGIPRELLPRSD